MRDLSNTKEILNFTPFDEIDLTELKERRLYLNGAVASTDMLIETTMYQDIFSSIVFYILKYNREDKDIPVEERKPIILYINSPGGCVSDGFGLIDTMITSKTPIYTVNLAMCASMGFLIFLAGDKRFSMPTAQALMHDGSIGAYDSSSKAMDLMKFEENAMKPATKAYVLSRTNISSEVYDEKYRMEWYMLPEEAKQYGICTHIIGKDCDIDEIL